MWYLEACEFDGGTSPFDDPGGLKDSCISLSLQESMNANASSSSRPNKPNALPRLMEGKSDRCYELGVSGSSYEAAQSKTHKCCPQLKVDLKIGYPDLAQHLYYEEEDSQKKITAERQKHEKWFMNKIATPFNCLDHKNNLNPLRSQFVCYRQIRTANRKKL
jgi:hypothetical protein